MEPEIFRVPFAGHELVGDRYLPDQPCQVLCVHGAGQSTRERNRSFRETLAERGIASVGYDQIGHGETGGELTQTSLKERTDQAMAVVEDQKLTMPLVVTGSSMGAHTAVKLTEIYPVSSLVLIVPGFYDAAAYIAQFGEEFTQIIRQPRSWDNTDAWQILNKFTGRLLVAAASEDRVIPSELVQKIYDSASNAKFRQIYTVKGATHDLMGSLAKDPPTLADYLKIITNFIAEGL